jgi:hypothetical protein
MEMAFLRRTRPELMKCLLYTLILGNAVLESIDVAFVLLDLLDKGQSHQALFPKPVVVIDGGFAEVSFFVDVAQVDTKDVWFFLSWFILLMTLVRGR